MFSFDYLSLFLILLNIFVFLLFSFLVFVIYKSYKTGLTEEEEVIKESSYKKAQALLDEARSKSMAILKDSTVKAKEVINSVEFLTEDVKKELHKEFNELSEAQFDQIEKLNTELLNSYAKALSEEKDKNVASLKYISDSIEKEAAQEISQFKEVSTNMEKEAAKELSEFRKVSEGIEGQAVKELDEFRKALEKETVASEKAVQEKLDQDYEKVRQKLTAYESEKMKQMDERINSVLADVAKEVFGTAIDLSTSEDMVMAALERAKAEGMF